MRFVNICFIRYCFGVVGRTFGFALAIFVERILYYVRGNNNERFIRYG